MNHREILQSFDMLPKTLDLPSFIKLCKPKEGQEKPKTRQDVRAYIQTMQIKIDLMAELIKNQTRTVTPIKKIEPPIKDLTNEE